MHLPWVSSCHCEPYSFNTREYVGAMRGRVFATGLSALKMVQGSHCLECEVVRVAFWSRQISKRSLERFGFGSL